MMSAVRELPEGWAVVTITELISSDGVFVDGDWIESKDQDPNGSIRLIQLADIGEGEFRNKSNRFLTKERAKELNCSFLKEGDILVARMPDPIGRACIFPLKGDEKFITAVDVAIIRLGYYGIDNKFLVHSINNRKIRNEIENLQSGTTRKRISRANLAKIKFPLPPLPEQHRIVAKIEELFSELDKGIESLKTAQQQLKVYRQAVLKYAFEGKLTNPDVNEGELPEGWVKKSLKELTIKADKVRLRDKNAEDEFYYLDIGGIDNSSNKIVSHKTYKWKAAPSRAQQIVFYKDILFSTVRTYLRNIAQVNDEKFDNHICSSGFTVLRADNNTDSGYLFKYVLYEGFLTPLNELQTGTSYPAVRDEDVLTQQINLPKSKEEQVKIVQEIESRLSVCDKIEESIEQGLQQAEALRQSILKSAFEGKLVPQDPNDEPASVLLERIKAERAASKPMKKSRKLKEKA